MGFFCKCLGGWKILHAAANYVAAQMNIHRNILPQFELFIYNFRRTVGLQVLFNGQKYNCDEKCEWQHIPHSLNNKQYFKFDS